MCFMEVSRCMATIAHGIPGCIYFLIFFCVRIGAILGRGQQCTFSNASIEEVNAGYVNGKFLLALSLGVGKL